MRKKTTKMADTTRWNVIEIVNGKTVVIIKRNVTHPTMKRWLARLEKEKSFAYGEMSN